MSTAGYDRRRGRKRALRGQVFIMFAGSLVVLVGILGLATDLGFSFAERRTMQNAADAGAMAGARIVAKATTTSPQSAWSDVQAMVNKNKIGSTNPTITECEYVSDPDGSGNEQDLGSCTGTVPAILGATVTGVRVTVQETHRTFFMQAVPGAANTVTTAATATAHVMVPSPRTDGPFLVCGINTVTSNANGNPIGIESILVQVNGKWVVNPLLVTQIRATPSLNPWFIIHYNQAQNPSQFADCNVPSSQFKGLANTAYDKSLTIPSNFQYTTGQVASIQSTIDGVGGCTTVANNCVAVLPVAINQPSSDGKGLYTVMLLPFYVVAIGNNPNTASKHLGQLVPDYIMYGASLPAQFGWTPSYSGPIVIRMTN